MPNSSKAAHLLDDAAALLTAPLSERKAYFLTDRWIGYPRAHIIHNDLNELAQYPRFDRTPCRVVVGPANNGKSSLVQRFWKANPGNYDEAAVSARVPVVYVRSVAQCDPLGLTTAIVHALGLPYDPAASLRAMRVRALGLLEEFQTRVIIIDEFNKLAEVTPAKQRDFVAEVRHIAVSLQVSIVCVGTKEAVVALQHHPSFSSRFKPLHLGKWEFGTDWARMMGLYGAMIPLPDPSGLHSKDFALALHRASEGLLGEAKDLLADMLSYAVSSNAPRLTKSMVAECGFIPPSRRYEMLSRMA